MGIRETCPKEGYLYLDQKIQSFAEELLTKEEIIHIWDLGRKLSSSTSQVNSAILELVEMFPYGKPRPLFYLVFEFGHLPHWTRNPIRYMGDYVDLLAKALLSTKIPKDGPNSSPFGVVIKRLEKELLITRDFATILTQYNFLFYRPGKHQFSRAADRKHTFTPLEVVYCAFITKKIGNKFKENETVLRIANEEIPFDHVF